MRSWVWNDNEGELCRPSKGNTVEPAQLSSTVGVIRNESVGHRLIPHHNRTANPVPITNDIIPHQDKYNTLPLYHSSIILNIFTSLLVPHASFVSQMSEFALRPGSAELQQPYPDIVWIQAVFTFSTDHAKCMGVMRLVSMPDRSWIAHTVFTTMQVGTARISPYDGF
jgi:hypothetical protein